MIYLFTVGLFNDYTISNLRLHSIKYDAYWIMYWKVRQRKQLWANLRYSLSIYLVGLSKIFHAIQEFVIIPQ